MRGATPECAVAPLQPNLSPVLPAYNTQGICKRIRKIEEREKEEVPTVSIDTCLPADHHHGDVYLDLLQPRERAHDPSRPLSLSPVHHPQTHVALVKGKENAADQHSHRIERQAVRVLGGGRAPRIVQEAAGEGEEMGSHAELWRLQAPDRDKPGVNQHQDCALRPDLCDTGSVIKKCSAAGRLRVTKRRLSRCER